MEEDQSQSQPQPSKSGGQAASGLEDYQFTFNCSAPSSTNGSFLEPDPQAVSMTDDSMSLTESIFDFPKRFGRTYHAYKEGSYMFPNDKLEQDRLAIQDYAFTKAMGDKLYFAPLDARPPRRILDIATGTGDWAIAMGDRFPEARVTATDLSPIQPDIVPMNVEFFVEDSSEPWVFSEPFDYIHTKTTGGCWESFETQIVQQAFDTLSPGGWFEAQECCPVPHCDDGTFKADSALALWFLDFLNAAVAAKRPHAEFGYLKSMMERVGFVDIHQRIFKVPLNGWARDPALKEIGQLMETNMQMGLSAFSLGLFNQVYGRTPEEIEVSLVEVRREVSDPSIHAYLPIFVAWGRKPFPGEQS
ncbi:S-adenosyl-L-methionine-dependent methyltransferase [Trichoderma citrinoviride]|uniref:S-adenosyl-L-methionine-dependent methyltransferase n=1 Tax=Trichoderma citrinoviride TaxID=58853 RepID=A0A2T4BK62_9HYPO|nr:S-adenosyl-L-methionine-dependent methyltransferase [Trichoderma citrinoviride]PTB69704.1 S-adenosyl-L-methionine-dependent methyltransferase [Trichoderma citrinoviride]